jgi:hypothetical protein
MARFGVDQAELAKLYSLMRVKIITSTLALVIMTVFASTAETPSGAETGIEGVITVSPIKPGPVRVGSPDSVPLANTAFVVENGNTEVASFTTDEQGRFRTSLQPGHYKVSMKGKKSGVGKFGPFEVDVVAGKMTNVQWECDSGIR